MEKLTVLQLLEQVSGSDPGAVERSGKEIQKALVIEDYGLFGAFVGLGEECGSLPTNAVYLSRLNKTKQQEQNQRLAWPPSAQRVRVKDPYEGLILSATLDRGWLGSSSESPAPRGWGLIARCSLFDPSHPNTGGWLGSSSEPPAEAAPAHPIAGEITY